MQMKINARNLWNYDFTSKQAIDGDIFISGGPKKSGAHLSAFIPR